LVQSESIGGDNLIIYEGGRDRGKERESVERFGMPTSEVGGG